MRDILFRGKRKDNGEWVEGDLRHGGYYLNDPDVYICVRFADTMINYPVDPETVGQYTGLTDKNGVKIFEGDIVKTRHDPFVVCYGEFRPKLYRDAVKYCFEVEPDCMDFGLFGGYMATGEEVVLTNNTHLFEVIDNIHDNPELLKGGGEE